MPHKAYSPAELRRVCFIAQFHFEEGAPGLAGTMLARAWELHDAPLHERIACFLPLAQHEWPDDLRSKLMSVEIPTLISQAEFERFSPAALRPLCESLLECKDSQTALHFAKGLAFTPTRKSLASAIRRSPDFHETLHRVSSLRSFDWLDGKLLDMLAQHSSWCGSNGVSDIASAEIERRALNRCSVKTPFSRAQKTSL